MFLFCGPLAPAFFFNGVIFLANAASNNLGHPLYSARINCGRQAPGTIPPVMLCAWLFGAPGVPIGQAVGGIVFAGIARALALGVVAGADRPSEPQPFQRQARLMQLFHLRR